MSSKFKWPKRLKFGFGFFVLMLFCLFVTKLMSFGAETAEWNSAKSLSGPSRDHLLGYGLYGQPVSELLSTGAEAVLLFGVIAVLISVCVALILGYVLATSQSESKTQRTLSYLLDVFGAVPGFLLSAVILYACGPSLWALVLAFSVANWDSSTRLAWSVGKLVVSRPSYLADTALGYNSARLFWYHYLPEAFGPLSAKFCSLLAFFIVFGASSVVIGVLDPQLFPWGALLNQGRHYFDVASHVFWAGWFLIFASTFILTMISSGIHLLFDQKIPR